MALGWQTIWAVGKRAAIRPTAAGVIEVNMRDQNVIQPGYAERFNRLNELLGG